MTTAKEAEEEINALLERWASAVRSKDIESIVADHTENFVMYDVPPPFQSVGLAEYRATWDTFYRWSEDPVIFKIVNSTVVVSEDVGFAYAVMQCAGRNDEGLSEVLDFRLTVGLVKQDGRWKIAHEHHSIPAE